MKKFSVTPKSFPFLILVTGGYICGCGKPNNIFSTYFQSTEDDHMDKPYLLEGINAMMDVASTINEFKRRKDLGESFHIQILFYCLYCVKWKR